MLDQRGQGFDMLASKLGAFVDALPRYTLYADHFRENKMLQNALGRLYVSYIEFCLYAARYFDKNGLGRFCSLSTLA